MSPRVYGALVGGALMALGFIVLSAQQAPGSFSALQASSGRAAYEQNCAACHLSDLKGSVGPALMGTSFLNAWGDRTSNELLALIRATMPPGADGSLSDQEYLEIIAYILQVNAHPPGTRPLRVDSPVRIGAATSPSQGPAGVGSSTLVDGRNVAADDPARMLFSGESMPTTADAVVTRAISGLTPVTDALLRRPPPEDWLSWRRTLDGHGYSPLNQITRANVNRLRLAWVWAVTDGANQGAPLVHDGIVYLVNNGYLFGAAAGLLVGGRF